MKPSPSGHTGFGHRDFFQWSRTCPHCAQTRGALSVVAVFFLPAIEPKSYGYAGGGFRSQWQLLPYGRQELHLEVWASELLAWCYRHSALDPDLLTEGRASPQSEWSRSPPNFKM